MKPTKVLTLILIAAATTPLAWLASTLMVLRGLPSPVSQLNISFTLVVAGLLILGLSVPIYRYRSELTKLSKAAASGTATTPAGAPPKRPKRVDPFYAVRVLVLSKAISFTSVLFIGWHAGVVISQLAAPVVPAGVWKNVLALVASGFALAAALVVERICRLPDDGAASAGAATDASPA